MTKNPSETEQVLKDTLAHTMVKLEYLYSEVLRFTEAKVIIEDQIAEYKAAIDEEDT